MRYCIVIVIMMVCCVSVQAATAPTLQHGVAQPPGEMLPLAATFEAQMVVRPGRPADTTRWYLVREPQRIETGRPSGRLAEIWERDARGEIALQRVFHADRRLVAYTAGELKARRLTPSWTALGSLLDPQTFVHLTRTGTRKVRSGTATVYKGALHGDQVETLVAGPPRAPRARRSTRGCRTVHDDPAGRADARPAGLATGDSRRRYGNICPLTQQILGTWHTIRSCAKCSNSTPRGAEESVLGPPVHHAH